MNKPSECEICASLRSIPEHLYELGEFCNYLHNESKAAAKENDTDDPSISAKTITISKWLKMASRIDKVNVDAWKFSDLSGLYCESVAGIINSDSSYFTNYATTLTIFIFFCNALEETYRFVSEHYEQHMETNNIPKNKRLKKSSMQACHLVDITDCSKIPKSFEHLTRNFNSIYDEYVKQYSPPPLSGTNNITNGEKSYCLHLIRNLRNHVAHGDFPLNENPDDFYQEGTFELLNHLLTYACRVGALYIQILIGNYNQGFLSHEYKMIKDAHGDEFEYFIENCTVNYVYHLHIAGKFSLTGTLR